MKFADSTLGRKYGYVFDRHDHRDVQFSAAPALAPSNVPEAVNLESFCGPVKDQSWLGACTAFSTTGLREFLYRKYYSDEKDKTVPPDSLVLSPMYLYYKGRAEEGTVDQNSGIYIRTAFRRLRHDGICLETEDPYQPNNYRKAPTSNEDQSAVRYSSGAYHRLINFNDMRSCLASGYPFVAGLSIYESFESKEVASTGIVSMPDLQHERPLGGHAVLFIGYDNSTCRFLVRNSWGKDWGMKGNFTVPYAMMLDTQLVGDCWMAHLGKAWQVAA